MGLSHQGRGEPELYKDKIEVSLDGRQIFYLFFGGAVLVGLVFVLGVMVGRRVESRSHVDGLSRVDPSRGASDPLAALDGLESKKLTFQDALTKSEPKTPVEAKIDEVVKAKALEAKAEPKVEAKPVAVPVVEKKDEKKPEKVEKKDVEKKLEKKPEKPEKKDEPVTKPEQSAKAEKTDKPEKSEKKKPVVEERVNADVITAVDKPADKKSESGRFTLQLSSFQDKHEAEAFLSSVKAAGYSAYVTEAEVSGKNYYRVRMGKYTSLDAANDAKADVEKAIKKSASVMRL
jgi:septal ring-binding cell division protein DamX